MAFPMYHYPHCDLNPNNLDAPTRAHMERVFTPTELAVLATTPPPPNPTQRRAKKKGNKR
jgi:hypothetical protein